MRRKSSSVAKLPRRGLASAAVVAMASVVAACGGSSGGSSETSGSAAPVTIGVSIELTGANALFGKQSADAMQLVADSINANGGIKELGGAKIQLQVSDNQTNPTTAAQQLRQQASQGVSAFLGPEASGLLAANQALIQQLQVPMFSPSLTDSVTDNNSSGYIFRTVARASNWTPRAVTFLKQLTITKNTPITRIGIVGTSVSPGPEIVDGWKAAAAANGWNATVVTYDPSNTKDYAPQVAKLKDANVQVVVGLQLADGTPFGQAVKASGWKPQYGWLWIAGAQYSNSFKQALGDSVNGRLVMSYTGGLATSQYPAEVQRVAQKFEQKEGQPLNGVNAGAASGVALIADAVSIAKSRDPVKVAAAARSLHFDSSHGSKYPYYMMPGGVSFDSNQDNVNWPGPIVQLEGTNDQVVVAPQKYATGQVRWPSP